MESGTKENHPRDEGISLLPNHIAVIMDGNGRWAARRGLPRIAGHKRGVDRARELVSYCLESGISYLTLFAFSSENWRRPQKEVNMLMNLFVASLDREIAPMHDMGVRFRIIGDIERFGVKLCDRVRKAEKKTENNKKLNLTIAANYGGRWDILQACHRIVREIRAGKLAPDTMTDKVISGYLSTSSLPEPDLFIRSGGERRLSNFLLWQLAYTELYFTEILWPDFDRNAFDAALNSFTMRQRRFGQTSEQIETAHHA